MFESLKKIKYFIDFYLIKQKTHKDWNMYLINRRPTYHHLW